MISISSGGISLRGVSSFGACTNDGPTAATAAWTAVVATTEGGGGGGGRSDGS
jgi:hypothetical protein